MPRVDEHQDDTAWFLMELFSMAPGQRPGQGSMLGQVVERHPRFRPARIGRGDPARQEVHDLPSQLEALVAEQEGAPDARLLLADDERAEYLWVQLVGDPTAGHPPRQARPTHLELGTGADAEEVVALFVDLAETVDPYFGFVTTRATALQERGFAAARRRRDPSPPTRAMGQAPHVYHEVCVPDVYWVQVYGPAYLARWGEGVLEGVGVDRRRLRNGGVVVRATEAPIFHPRAAAPEDHAWKQRVYEAVGPERFAREDQPWGDYGQRVPLLKEHAEAAVGWGGGLGRERRVRRFPG